MFKKKNAYVVAITVGIVVLVICSSFLGLVVYLQWRQLRMTYDYYETIARIETVSYEKNIEVEYANIKSGFKNIPYCEGRIANKGKRTVISIALRINFLDSLGKTVYSYLVFPLEPLRSPKIIKGVYITPVAFIKNTSIKPGESLMFKCIIWKCPRKYIKMVNRDSFSDKPGQWCGKVKSDIVQIRLHPS